MTKPTEQLKVFADFNNCDKQGRVRLNTIGTVEDLNRLGIILREDLKILIGGLELEAEGTVTYSNEEGVWVARVDWDNIRELPGNRLP
jgi:hypothetical protein